MIMWLSLVVAAISPDNRRRLQTAEPTPWWDQRISDCLTTEASADTLNAKLEITQDSLYKVSVSYTGYPGGKPKMLWVANGEGTILGLRDDSNMTASSFDWTPGANTAAPWAGSANPIGLQAGSCPQVYNQTKVSAWKGLYDDAIAVCCATDTTHSDPQFQPTVSSNNGFGNGQWYRQEATVSALQFAPVLNYVVDDAGKLLSVDAGGTGAYSRNTVKITPLTSYVEACAALSTEADTVIYNPLCTKIDLVPKIVANLRQNAPIEKTAQAFANITFSGLVERPFVTFTARAPTNPESDSYCVTYISKANTNTADVVAYSASSEVSLDLLASELSGVAMLYVFSKCGVKVQNSRNPPVYIPAPARSLDYASFDLAALVQQGKLSIAESTTNAGSGVLSTDTGKRCDVAYMPNKNVYVVRINDTLGTQENCTCIVAAGEIEPTWSCTNLVSSGFTYLTTGQVAGISVACTFLALVLIGVCVTTKLRNRKRPRYNTQVAMPGAAQQEYA
jgi:hypothetical protein